MNKTLFILAVTILTAVFGTTSCVFGTKNPQTQEKTQTAYAVQIGKVHPIIESIFYGLPLDKSRLDLREVILKDKRFVLTDTTFNDYPPSTFFKGITVDKGLIKSKPDSIQVMLIYGNAYLITEKGGQEDSIKHLMILNCQYFFSNKESALLEYGRMLNIVHPIFSDTSSIRDDQWATEYTKGKQNGIQKGIGKSFDCFEPYYRVALSTISFMPADGSTPVFVLDITFSKEDK